MSDNKSTLAIILAAGLGTRMKSTLPKVMHRVGGLPLLGHVLKSVQPMTSERAVVIGPQMDQTIGTFARDHDPSVSIHIQEERLGTAHAVLAADHALLQKHGRVFVLFGDTPLIKNETLAKLGDALDRGFDIAVLGFETNAPTGYGRLLTDGNELIGIREEREATAAEKAIGFCNSGVMAFEATHILDILLAISNQNAKGEYYLTDAIEVARSKGLRATAVKGDEPEFIGINDQQQLAAAERIFQDNKRREMLENGVTLIDPESVFFSYDTEIGPDTIVEPNVVFAPGVSVASNVRIHAFSHLEATRIGSGSMIGPFARLRPGNTLGENVKVGNFVEMKKANVANGAKISHLSYVGDATVGADANIGAGTITCNYDGFSKYQTVIGEGAFVGSNSSLVAPITIGDGAYVGSGSVITKDVEPDALAVARGKQIAKPGWALSFKKLKKSVT